MECDDWIISTDECCRNGAITNLQNPAGDWIYVETLLNNTQPFTDNNISPVFNDDPVSIFICDGQDCYNNGRSGCWMEIHDITNHSLEDLVQM